MIDGNASTSVLDDDVDGAAPPPPPSKHACIFFKRLTALCDAVAASREQPFNKTGQSISPAVTDDDEDEEESCAS